MVAALSTVVRPRRRRVSGSDAPPGPRAMGGRGVFILLDKVWVQLLHPCLVQLLHPPHLPRS